MKRLNSLLVVLAVVVAVAVTSCTTSQGPYDESYDRNTIGQYDVARQVGNRLYLEDPYRGTVVLERDPYTGRYYDVTSRYGYYSPYNSYGSRVYSNNTYYNRNNYPTTNTQTQQQAPQRGSEDWQKAREEARKRVLGKGN